MSQPATSTDESGLRRAYVAGRLWLAVAFAAAGLLWAAGSASGTAESAPPVAQQAAAVEAAR